MSVVVVRLPVVGTEVALRPPVGADDLLLLEAGPPEIGLALALLGRVARTAEGGALDVAALPLTDVDALLLRLHQYVLGDVVQADQHCPAPACGARVDISFSIDAYLAHHAPGTPADVVPATEDGWYCLLGDSGARGAVEFRLPRAEDQRAIAWTADPEAALLARCVRPAELAAPLRERVEDAMEALAPSLHSELEGACPECGAAVQASFDPLEYTLRALRRQAGLLYAEVCSIAHYCHWSETDILALPAVRRARYAELAAQKAAHERSTA